MVDVTWERVAWFLIGADAMGLFMFGMLLFHRSTQRKWLSLLRRWLSSEGPKP